MTFKTRDLLGRFQSSPQHPETPTTIVEPSTSESEGPKMVYESDFYTTRRYRTSPSLSTYTVSYAPSKQVRLLPGVGKVHVVHTYDRIVPYVGHKRLTVVTPPPQIFKVRPSVLLKEFDRISYKYRPPVAYSYVNNYLNSDSAVRVYYGQDPNKDRLRIQTPLSVYFHHVIGRPSKVYYDVLGSPRWSRSWYRYWYDIPSNRYYDDILNSLSHIPSKYYTSYIPSWYSSLWYSPSKGSSIAPYWSKYWTRYDSPYWSTYWHPTWSRYWTAGRNSEWTRWYDVRTYYIRDPITDYRYTNYLPSSVYYHNVLQRPSRLYYDILGLPRYSRYWYRYWYTVPSLRYSDYYDYDYYRYRPSYWYRSSYWPSLWSRWSSYWSPTWYKYNYPATYDYWYPKSSYSSLTSWYPSITNWYPTLRTSWYNYLSPYWSKFWTSSDLPYHWSAYWTPSWSSYWRLYWSKYWSHYYDLMFSDETSRIRADAAGLLKRIHSPVVRSSLTLLPYSTRYSDVVPSRFASDEYIYKMLSTSPHNAKVQYTTYYTEPVRKYIGPGHLSAVSYAGGKAYDRRRQMWSKKDPVKNDIQLLSYYISKFRNEPPIKKTVPLSPARPTRHFSHAKFIPEPEKVEKVDHSIDRASLRLGKVSEPSQEDVEARLKRQKERELARVAEEKALVEEAAKKKAQALKEDAERKAELARQEELAAQAAAERAAELERKAEQARQEELAKQSEIERKKKEEEERIRQEEERKAADAAKAEEERQQLLRLEEIARQAEEERERELARQAEELAELARQEAELEEKARQEAEALAQAKREEEIAELARQEAELQELEKQEKELAELARQEAEVAELAKHEADLAKQEAEIADLATQEAELKELEERQRAELAALEEEAKTLEETFGSEEATPAEEEPTEEAPAAVEEAPEEQPQEEPAAEAEETEAAEE